MEQDDRNRFSHFKQYISQIAAQCRSQPRFGSRVILKGPPPIDIIKVFCFNIQLRFDYRLTTKLYIMNKIYTFV